MFDRIVPKRKIVPATEFLAALLDFLFMPSIPSPDPKNLYKPEAKTYVQKKNESLMAFVAQTKQVMTHNRWIGGWERTEIGNLGPFMVKAQWRLFIREINQFGWIIKTCRAHSNDTYVDLCQALNDTFDRMTDREGLYFYADPKKPDYCLDQELTDDLIGYRPTSSFASAGYRTPADVSYILDILRQFAEAMHLISPLYELALQHLANSEHEKSSDKEKSADSYRKATIFYCLGQDVSDVLWKYSEFAIGTLDLLCRAGVGIALVDDREARFGDEHNHPG